MSSFKIDIQTGLGRAPHLLGSILKAIVGLLKYPHYFTFYQDATEICFQCRWPFFAISQVFSWSAHHFASIFLCGKSNFLLSFKRTELEVGRGRFFVCVEQQMEKATDMSMDHKGIQD